MASTYSPKLRLELIGAGEQAGLWGSTTNKNIGQLIEQAIAGVTTVELDGLSGNYTLTALDGTPDQSRSAVIKCTYAAAPASGPINLIIPTQTKLYVVRNDCGQTITVKTSAQVGGVVILDGESTLVFCDGTNAEQGIETAAVGTLTVSGGGTGVTTFGAGGIIRSAGGTAALSAGAVTLNSSDTTGTLPVNKGGTGATSFTAGRLLVGNGTSQLAVLAGSVDGQVVTWNNSLSEWVAQTPAAGVSSFSAGTTGFSPSIASTGAVTLSGTLNVANGGTGATTFGIGFIKSASGGTGALSSASTINLSTEVSNTLAVANGGTGRNTLTSGALLIGNGTTAVNQLTGTSIGQVPQWNGTTWTTASLPSGGVTNVTASAPLASSGGGTPNISLTGTVATANGGTGLTSFTSGGAVYATSTSALTTGTLPTASGGTGLTSFTAGGAIYAATTSALTSGTLPIASGGTGSTTAPSSGQLLIGNGSGGYAVANLTAGSGVTITNGAGSITIAATGTSGVSTFSAGTTGLTPSTATSGAVTLGGTLGLANGGTGATTATGALNNMSYAPSGTGAVTRSAPAKMGDIVSTADYTTQANAVTAAGVKPLVNPSTGKVWFAQPANPTFDEASNVLGRTLAFDNQGTTMVVPASDNYNYIGIRNGGNYNVHSIGANGLVAGLTFYLNSASTSSASSNMYGVIGVVQNSGPGTTKAIYGRATQASGSTGVVMGGVFAVDTRTGGGAAVGIQMTFDTSTSGGSAYNYIWMTSNTASVASAQYGILADALCSVSDAFIQYAAVGAGAFLNLQNGAQTRNIFRIESNGCATFNNGVASTKMIDLQNGGQINFTGTAASATAGGTAIPATCAQYITIQVNGSPYKIAVFT